eukprot:TRINITY_DN80105_c0_g1_i1.p1 TRINITY_DN80105_c0_g1~~TRINITY_DN80105_c0_g1_i1.p1  ORF type:complete len:286 (-),score=44.07 TRINITY_DN80105_c0_g1_i1:38-895(-)
MPLAAVKGWPAAVDHVEALLTWKMTSADKAPERPVTPPTLLDTGRRMRRRGPKQQDVADGIIPHNGEAAVPQFGNIDPKCVTKPIPPGALAMPLPPFKDLPAEERFCSTYSSCFRSSTPGSSAPSRPSTQGTLRSPMALLSPAAVKLQSGGAKDADRRAQTARGSERRKQQRLSRQSRGGAPSLRAEGVLADLARHAAAAENRARRAETPGSTRSSALSARGAGAGSSHHSGRGKSSSASATKRYFAARHRPAAILPSDGPVSDPSGTPWISAHQRCALVSGLTC